MSTTGAKFPTHALGIDEDPWLDEQWNDPSNVYADDGVTASVTGTKFDSGDQTYVLKVDVFNFSSIPDAATILGVICRVNTWYRSGQGSGSMDLMQLLNPSHNRVGTNQCSTPVALTTNNTTIITKGSSTDLWGNALTPAWVKNSAFGVGLGIIATAEDADVDIDYVTLEIYYTGGVNYTLTCESGSYSLTGQSAALRAARKISAVPGSYAYAGQPVDLKVARKLTASPGSYLLTGQDAVLRAIRKIAAAAGSYAYTGQDANLLLGHHYALVCEPGYYGEPYSKIFVTLDGRIYKKMGNTYLRLS